MAHGFFLNPDAAIKSLWDILDWFILLATFVAMVTYLSLCGPAPEVDVGFHSINTGTIYHAVNLLLMIGATPLIKQGGEQDKPVQYVPQTIDGCVWV